MRPSSVGVVASSRKLAPVRPSVHDLLYCQNADCKAPLDISEIPRDYEAYIRDAFRSDILHSPLGGSDYSLSMSTSTASSFSASASRGGGLLFPSVSPLSAATPASLASPPAASSSSSSSGAAAAAAAAEACLVSFRDAFRRGDRHAFVRHIAEQFSVPARTDFPLCDACGEVALSRAAKERDYALDQRDAADSFTHALQERLARQQQQQQPDGRGAAAGASQGAATTTSSDSAAAPRPISVSPPSLPPMLPTPPPSSTLPPSSRAAAAGPHHQQQHHIAQQRSLLATMEDEEALLLAEIRRLNAWMGCGAGGGGAEGPLGAPLNSIALHPSLGGGGGGAALDAAAAAEEREILASLGLAPMARFDGGAAAGGAGSPSLSAAAAASASASAALALVRTGEGGAGGGSRRRADLSRPAPSPLVRRAPLSLVAHRLGALEACIASLEGGAFDVAARVGTSLRALREHNAEYRDRDARGRTALAHMRYLTTCNDAVFIWHRGPFGTVNGLRLGRLPAQPVEWNEINAALGLTAFLLTRICARLGFNSPKYRIVPLGSFTRISPIGTGGDSATHELFYNTRAFWPLKPLNAALKTLAACVAEVGEHALSLDRSFWWPHPITHGGERIADLPVALGQKDAQWTRAMKCLLTDLKWLLAWAYRQPE